MREKIIKRFAAGTIGVCFAYALIRQPFAVMNDPKELISSDWSTAAQSAVQPTTTVTTVPSTSAAEQLTETPTEIAETIPPAQTETEAPETETVTNPVQEEIVEDKNTSQNSSGEEIQPDPPKEGIQQADLRVQHGFEDHTDDQRGKDAGEIHDRPVEVQQLHFLGQQNSQGKADHILCKRRDRGENQRVFQHPGIVVIRRKNRGKILPADEMDLLRIDRPVCERVSEAYHGRQHIQHDIQQQRAENEIGRIGPVLVHGFPPAGLSRPGKRTVF